MTELVSLKTYDTPTKIALLEGLDYKSDGVFVLDKDGKKLIDKYIDTPIKLDEMLILPGSTVIICDNEISILGYIEEYGDGYL